MKRNKIEWITYEHLCSHFIYQVASLLLCNRCAAYSYKVWSLIYRASAVAKRELLSYCMMTLALLTNILLVSKIPLLDMCSLGAPTGKWRVKQVFNGVVVRPTYCREDRRLQPYDGHKYLKSTLLFCYMFITKLSRYHC